MSGRGGAIVGAYVQVVGGEDTWETVCMHVCRECKKYGGFVIFLFLDDKVSHFDSANTLLSRLFGIFAVYLVSVVDIVVVVDVS